mmetsp:Transcript_42514/g.106112  ORF Transcript_42514/g.106112 Transcript_42514/m.106112 type:complete len:83 (+) Transcript_42514:190-438(+)
MSANPSIHPSMGSQFVPTPAGNSKAYITQQQQILTRPLINQSLADTRTHTSGRTDGSIGRRTDTQTDKRLPATPPTPKRPPT